MNAQDIIARALREADGANRVAQVAPAPTHGQVAPVAPHENPNENNRVARVAPGSIARATQFSEENQSGSTGSTGSTQKSGDESRSADDDLERLRTAAGPDWPVIRDDPAALEALRTALEAERARTEGIAPPDYTQPAYCGGCGPVLLWFGAPTRVMACPWCDNRINGRPIPMPATPPPAPTVTCGTCEHYIVNERGAGGLGRCGIDAPAARIPPSLWPRGEHRCADWRADNHG